MVQIGIVAANVSGDIGGVGISRIHFQSQNATTLTPADAQAAANAMRAMWFGVGNLFAADVTWTWQSTVTVIEHASAELQAILALGTVPSNVSGSAAGSYPAGNGARVDWLTQSLHGRRFMRAANFLVPLGNVAYNSSGAVAGASVTQIQGAGATMLTQLGTAGLELVAYSRPPKGTTVGGHVGLVVGVRVPTQPATLRSRRS
jgi:hypothetical protein